MATTTRKKRSGSGRLPIHAGEAIGSRKIKHRGVSQAPAKPTNGTGKIPHSPNIQEHRDEVEGYVDDVLSGRLVTGVLEQFACQRYLDDLGRKDVSWELDENLAALAIDWFATLRHTQGRYYGEPFLLYPIQAFCIWNLFGFVNRETRHRRFREFLYSVARGNGKTPLGAGILLRVTGYDIPTLKRATSYCAATTSKQARLAYEDIGHFINSSGLQDYLQVQRDRIKIPVHDSTIEPLPAVGGATSGLRIYALNLDELHAFTAQHRTYYNELITGLNKFPQSLKTTITTAGDEDSEIWSEERDHAVSVLTRDNDYEDDRLFAMICEIDDNDKEIPENLPKANPLMRHNIVSEEYLLNQLKKGENSPQIKASNRRYHFNKLTESTVKSITSAMWAKGAGGLPDLDGIIPFAGADFGITRDFSAIAYCFELESEDESRRFALEVDCFAPLSSDVPLHKEPFRSWIDQGFIRITETETVDMGEVYASIERRVAKHGISGMACDGSFAFEFVQNCQKRYDFTLESFKQSMTEYAEPLAEFKRALTDGRLLHGDNPVLGWAAGNMKERSNDMGHSMPTKRKSTGKIDPIVACIMAFGKCLLTEPVIDSYATSYLDLEDDD